MAMSLLQTAGKKSFKVAKKKADNFFHGYIQLSIAFLVIFKCIFPCIHLSIETNMLTCFGNSNMRKQLYSFY